ncbi:MAG: hypothetical protein C4299_04745, partial [Thermoleophilia bacterium]
MPTTEAVRAIPTPAPEQVRAAWSRWRHPRARLSLRWRLTLLFAAVFGLILIALFLTLHHFLLSTLLSDADDELETHATRIAAQAANPEVFNDPERLRQLISAGTVGGLVTSPSL